MRKLTLIVTILALIALAIAVSFFSTKFSSQKVTVVQQPTPISVAPTQIPTAGLTPTSAQTTTCQPDQLKATITSQGAAGSIYANLTVTNTSKTACEVMLGNSITAKFEAKNIVMHYEQPATSHPFMLAPSATVYSQIHYPNGPQCQSGITQVPITFYYQTNQLSIPFASDSHMGNLTVQACNSQTEETPIDTWPLSKNPITP